MGNTFYFNNLLQYIVASFDKKYDAAYKNNLEYGTLRLRSEDFLIFVTKISLETGRHNNNTIQYSFDFNASFKLPS